MYGVTRQHHHVAGVKLQVHKSARRVAWYCGRLTLMWQRRCRQRLAIQACLHRCTMLLPHLTSRCGDGILWRTCRVFSGENAGVTSGECFRCICGDVHRRAVARPIVRAHQRHGSCSVDNIGKGDGRIDGRSRRRGRDEKRVAKPKIGVRGN